MQTTFFFNLYISCYFNLFTITAKILARSLAKFLSSLSGQTHGLNNFVIYAMQQQARVDNLAICYRKKQITVSFSCVCPVIDNECRHNIVKVVCGSTRRAPRRSTATIKTWTKCVIH